MLADELFSQYEQAGGGDAGKWRALMMAVGDQVSQDGNLPPAIAAKIHEVHAGWAAGVVQEDFLLQVKRECWAFLQAKHGNSVTIQDREDRAVRAALSLLDPSGDEEAADGVADWVDQMLSPRPFPQG
jgi:hypothetical protein